MSDAQNAFILREAIIMTRSGVEAELASLAALLAEYGFVLNNCDVTIDLDRTYDGDVHYRFDVQIGVGVNLRRPTSPPATTAPSTPAP